MKIKSLFFSAVMFFLVGSKLCNAVPSPINDYLFEPVEMGYSPIVEDFNSLDDEELSFILSLSDVRKHCPVTPISSPATKGDDE